MHRSYTYTCIKNVRLREGRSGKCGVAESAEFELCRVISYAETAAAFFFSLLLPPTSCDFITVKTHRRTERNIYIRINPRGKKNISRRQKLFLLKDVEKKTVRRNGE